MTIQHFRTMILIALSAALAACQITQPPTNTGDSESESQIANTQVATVVLPSIRITDAASDLPQYTNIWERISAGLRLQEHYLHPMVEAEISSFTNNTKYFELVALRAEPFLYWIVEEIDRRDLPLELALVPIVESAFNSQAYSSEHAVGLWQFIGSTANSFGLERDWWYDGRRDPLASTVAALDYLELLYAEFNNDWLLALAAYNSGEGSMRRALQSNSAASSDKFWNLNLPKETRGHVPRILAVAKIIAEPERFGITLPVIDNTEYFEAVTLDSQIDLVIAAQLAAIAPEELRALNPGYLQWATQPDSNRSLLLPKGKAELFLQQVSNFPAQQRVAWDRYEIKSGDTLGSIAVKMGTRAEILQQINGMSNSGIIAGNSLLIPRNGNASLSIPVPITQPLSPDPAPGSYRVRRGDNLWSIARRLDQRSADIAAWNNITIDSVLQPGQLLLLKSTDLIAATASNESHTQPLSHRVVRGDSLAQIAGKFNVSIEDIVNWNQLKATAYIFPGQEILLFPARIPTN